MDFTWDALGHGMWDVTHLLEQWACSKAKGLFGRIMKLLLTFPLLQAHNPDSLKDMQVECSGIINGTLSMHTAFPPITIC